MSEEFSNDSSGSEPSEIASIAEGILSEPSQPSEYDTAPQSWKPEVAQRHWRTLDPDLRGYLHSRDKEQHEKITQQGQRMKELEGVSTRYQPIDGIFERYRPHIPEGLEPAQAIEALLNVQQMITTPETREQAFAQLLQSCGVDPMALLPPQMREQFETAQRELQQTRVAEVQKTLDDFTKDKTYYAEIREDVIKEIVEIRRGAPGLDNATVLRLAHDRVVDRTGIKGRLELEAKAKEFEESQKAAAERAKVQRAEEAKRVAAARRAAGINVRSSPSTFSAPKTLDEELRTIADRAYRR
jgi:hypothetical protein